MIHFNYDSNKMTDVIILGVPDHLNQIGKITYQNSDLTQTIENDRHRHIVSSQLGKTSSTILYINNEPKRLITVGLGNLKTLSYASFLKVFGTLFQYLKKERVTEANVLFDTFNSKYCFTFPIPSIARVTSFPDPSLDVKSGPKSK